MACGLSPSYFLQTTHFWKKMTDKFGNCNGKVCPQCTKQFGHSSGVLMHLGAKHNYIMEFAPQNVQEQLRQLGVDWGEPGGYRTFAGIVDNLKSVELCRKTKTVSHQLRSFGATNKQKRRKLSWFYFYCIIFSLYISLSLCYVFPSLLVTLATFRLAYDTKELSSCFCVKFYGSSKSVKLRHRLIVAWRVQWSPLGAISQNVSLAFEARYAWSLG